MYARIPMAYSGLRMRISLSKFRYLMGSLYLETALPKQYSNFAKGSNSYRLPHLLNDQLANSFTVEEIKIPVPWGHIAGKWWGPKDKQPIIAIHGWQNNAGTWDNFIPLLPINTSVLCLDLPGHGLSSHYPKGMVYYLFWDAICLLRRIIKHFKWSKVTLMGHSLAGSQCFIYAGAFPNDIDRIISIEMGTSIFLEPGKIVNSVSSGLDKYLEYENVSEDKTYCYSYEEIIDIVYNTYEGSVSKENCCVLMKRGMTPTPVHLKNNGYFFKRDPRLKVSGLVTLPIETALEFASKVKCKVLNLRAVPGDKWERSDYYMSIIRQLKVLADVRYVEVEGVHFIQLEAPETIVKYVQDFLEIR